MFKILLDTSTLVYFIVRRDRRYRELFEELVEEHLDDLTDLQLIVPIAVQAELYGVLRSGRLSSKINGVKTTMFYSHEEILDILANPQYDHSVLFDHDFLHSLKDFDWPETEETSVNYKQIIFTIVESTYDWQDWGEAFIRDNIGFSPKDEGKNDIYDYPIMATALLERVHLILTENIRDFVIPLGAIFVLNIERFQLIEDRHFWFDVRFGDLKDW